MYLTKSFISGVSGFMNLRTSVMRYISLRDFEASLNGAGGTGQLASNPTSLGGRFFESRLRKFVFMKSRNYKRK